MKKGLAAFLLFCLLFCMSSCSDTQTITHAGINAEVLELSTELPVMTVRHLGPGDFLGAVDEVRLVSCADESCYFVYAWEEDARFDLSFNDIQIGDKITIDVTVPKGTEQYEDFCVHARRIQILSPRPELEVSP